MKTLKLIALFCLTILSQVVFAGEWTEVNLNKDGYRVRISYTKMILPATYGSQGGVVSGRAFLEVFSPAPALAEKVEILEASGRKHQVKNSMKMDLITSGLNSRKVLHTLSICT